MAQLNPQQLRQFARLGAEARLAQLDVEIAAIKSMYPDLAQSRAIAPAAAPAGRPARRRKRYRMSPEARKAAAERMRKYWAERRAAKQARQPTPNARKHAVAARKTAKRKTAGRKRASKA